MVRKYVREFTMDADFNAFLDEFQRETDRAAAVLGVAYADDLLRRLFLASFVDDNPSSEAIMKASGPLGNFFARPDHRDCLENLVRDEIRHVVPASRFGHAIEFEVEIFPAVT